MLICISPCVSHSDVVWLCVRVEQASVRSEHSGSVVESRGPGLRHPGLLLPLSGSVTIMQGLSHNCLLNCLIESQLRHPRMLSLLHPRESPEVGLLGERPNEGSFSKWIPGTQRGLVRCSDFVGRFLV